MNKIFHKKSFFAGSAIILIFCGVLAILDYTNTLNILGHKNKPQESTIPSTSPNKSNVSSPESTKENSSSNATSTSGSGKTTSNQTVGTGLIAPYGSFISNHRPGQNGSNLLESSQCITTPGAKCYIKFTKGNIVKTLEEKPADSEGSVFWEWNTSDAGLSSGNWTVTAVATMGGQIKTTTDQVEMEIN